MCTLTYYPTASGYILTSSRDEQASRATNPPARFKIGGQNAIFPTDTQSGGTWIATTENRTCCLLNGAFEKHINADYYKLSRGQILLKILFVEDIESFFNQYDFQDIAPFTLICLCHDTGQRLTELVWDGRYKHLWHLNEQQAFIWSSATLYDKQTRNMRLKWFEDFRNEDQYIDKDALWKFHFSHHTDNKSKNILMKRASGVQTVSVSQVSMEESEIIFKYLDLVNEKECQLGLPGFVFQKIY